jgi:histidinol-phosphate aminotransferase
MTCMLSRRMLIRSFGLGAASLAFPVTSEASPGLTSGALSASGEGAGPIRLDTTHNAYGPSAKAVGAIGQSVKTSGDYPDAASEDLREKIANRCRVAKDQIVLGCGSGEILRMAASAYTDHRRKLVMASPTCDLIGRYAVRGGAALSLVPLTRTYAHDLPAMAALCDSATGLVYICNPNNPTGTMTRRQDLETFLTKVPQSSHILIDEVYHEYVEQSDDTVSFIDRPVDDDRVIVVRSFSKIHGLAGLRVGYAVTTARTANLLHLHGLERNVNVAAAKAAAASLGDARHVPERVRLNVDDRQEFINQVHVRMLRVIDSRTNFIMLDSQRRAGEVIAHFRRHNIVLAKPFPRFDRHIRVCLGTRAQMREFWRVWDLMPAVPGHSM